MPSDVFISEGIFFSVNQKVVAVFINLQNKLEINGTASTRRVN